MARAFRFEEDCELSVCLGTLKPSQLTASSFQERGSNYMLVCLLAHWVEDTGMKMPPLKGTSLMEVMAIDWMS